MDQREQLVVSARLQDGKENRENHKKQVGSPQPRAERKSQSLPPDRAATGAKRAPGRAVLGLLLLAVAAVLVLPAPPAQAAVLVSNLWQSTTTTTLLSRYSPDAQGFKTGTHPAGYSLNSVQLHVDSFVSPATINDLSITLRADLKLSGYNWPAYDALVTFVNPTFTSAETLSFTLPNGTTFDLDPETNYFVLIDLNHATDRESGITIGNTTMTSEDSGVATGWEILDESVWADDDAGTVWFTNYVTFNDPTTANYMHRIAVDATPKNTPATGLPTITGMAAAVGHMLTAVRTGIADANGLSGVDYGYQWIRVDDMANEIDIDGATSSTYTLVPADVGQHFKVKVTFKDNGGFDEALTSKLHPSRMGGICARTAQVRDAIVAATPATTCANVTTTHLSSLRTLDLRRQSISILQSGDFAGLTHLNTLYLPLSLTSLPADIFAGLSNLTGLSLYSTTLSSLPANIFAGLSNLTRLGLYDNALSRLPSGIFDELTALEELLLYGNALSSLPAGIFDNLAALTFLNLADNDLTELPAGIFDNLTALTFLNLSYNDNDLTELPNNIFDRLSNLTTLHLSNNALDSLPANVFQNLTRLSTLTLSSNANTDPFAPTADAGEDQMVATGATVTLLAGSSTGPWGTNVIHAWTQTSGTTVTLTDANTASPSFTAPSTAGDLEFTLTASGRPAGASGTGTGTDTVTVEVTDPRTLATLDDLTLSDGTRDATLAPEFAPDEAIYTASVLHGVPTLTVTPTPTGSNATVEYLDDNDNAITDTDSTTPELEMALTQNLAATTHVIKVKVTAETGTPKATETYTVTVTKEASDVELPGKPTGLMATPAADPTQIDLSWTAPDNNGNSDLTGYRIEVSTDDNAGLDRPGGEYRHPGHHHLRTPRPRPRRHPLLPRLGTQRRRPRQPLGFRHHHDVVGRHLRPHGTSARRHRGGHGGHHVR